MPASVCLGGLLIIRSILYIPHHFRRQWTCKHILVSKKIGRKEGRKCFYFNGAFNTFYLRLYGVGQMVTETRCATTWAFFLISSEGSFYMHHPTDRIAHSTAFVIDH